MASRSWPAPSPPMAPSQQVGVAMPSLRASTLTRELVDSLASGRKSGFTVAPEAGTQRLRDVVNKNLTEEDVLNATTVVFSSGWNLVKLYFMLGLPTEMDEDVEAIARLAEAVVRAARSAGNRKAQVNLATSSFVPKPFTPFQWRPMERPESLLAKQGRLKQLLKTPRGLQVARRADRAWWRPYSPLGTGAWAGPWSGPPSWAAGWTRGRSIFVSTCGSARLPTREWMSEIYIHRERTRSERLPWDHLDMGVRKDFLWREWEKALAVGGHAGLRPGILRGVRGLRPPVRGGGVRKEGAGSGEQGAGRAATTICPSPLTPTGFAQAGAPDASSHPLTCGRGQGTGDRGPGKLGRDRVFALLTSSPPHLLTP